MSAQIHVFLCRQDNIGVLIHDPNTGACAAIDAPEEKPILAALARTGWQLTDILVTHRHGDHVQAVDGLKRRTGCRVVAPVKAREAVPHADAYVREHVQFARADSIESLVDAWLQSPSHRANLLDAAIDAYGLAVMKEADGQWTAVLVMTQQG